MESFCNLALSNHLFPHQFAEHLDLADLSRISILFHFRICCTLKVRARQRIEVSMEGPQPVLITAATSGISEISIDARIAVYRLRYSQYLSISSCLLCLLGISPDFQAPHNIYLRRDGRLNPQRAAFVSFF